MTYIPEGNYLSLQEAADRASVARITVQKWIEHGLLPAIIIPKLGRLIDEKNLEAFMKLERPTGFPKGRSRK